MREVTETKEGPIGGRQTQQRVDHGSWGDSVSGKGRNNCVRTAARCKTTQTFPLHRRTGKPVALTRLGSVSKARARHSALGPL